MPASGAKACSKLKEYEWNADHCDRDESEDTVCPFALQSHDHLYDDER